MKVLLSFFICLQLAWAQWFFGNSLSYSTDAKLMQSISAKLYVQNSNFPRVALTAGYSYYRYIQPGVTYTQSGTSYLIAKDQALNENALFLGLNATLFATGNFYIDGQASYIALQKLTFSAPIEDATFPRSGYSAGLGLGYVLGSSNVRLFYKYLAFDQDYIVLNQTMLSLSAQHTFGLEFIYWY